VRSAFEQIIAESGGGAAFAVLRRGEPLVDLWGGKADPAEGAPWRADALTVLFSGTKGIAATLAGLFLDPWGAG
jgi:CubicO group peptidase (beta-lactamase class C family)